MGSRAMQDITAGFSTATRRVIVVITLMVLAAWTLRGYFPGNRQAAERPEPHDSPAALAAVIVLLCAAVAIIGFAVIVRMRDRRPARAPAGALRRGSVAGGRPSWRFTLVALAAVIAWLLLVMLLTRVTTPGPSETPPSAPPAASDTSAQVSGGDEPTPDNKGDKDTSGTNVVSYLIPPMLILMGLVVVGTAVASRRQRRRPAPSAVNDADPPPTPAAATSLARAAELGLAEIGDLSREPREAIIACYAAMERELTHVPGAAPLDCDTPSEVLARAVDHHALRAESATQLVELFEEARFSPHVMNEGHRDIAVDALRLVLADLRSMA
jgi:Domain of unknown function (DUF4129)